jgi:hypothetical protein
LEKASLKVVVVDNGGLAVVSLRLERAPDVGSKPGG